MVFPPTAMPGKLGAFIADAITLSLPKIKVLLGTTFTFIIILAFRKEIIG